MNRLEWLRDRITQMGHPPHLYERWHAEIEAIERGRPRESEAQRRRQRALAAAGCLDGQLPPGMVYAHGAVMTEAEARTIGDLMTALGPDKPASGSARYYQLASQQLRSLRCLGPHARVTAQLAAAPEAQHRQSRH